MKKLFILCSLLFSTEAILAQFLPQDSTLSLTNPGYAYLRYLKYYADQADGKPESSMEKEMQREFEFWQYRLPQGEGVLDPFYQYAKALKTAGATGNNCIPAAGDFNGNWRFIGPKTEAQTAGEVFAISVDPNNPANIAIGVSDGGLWTTTTATTTTGGTWNCVSDNFLNNGSIGIKSIARSPFGNKDELYAVTDISTSGNRGGVTWGYGQGIWKSVDNGVSWTLESGGIANDFTSGTSIEFCPFKVNGGTDEMIIITDGEKVYQKIGGSAWTNITPTAAIPEYHRPFRDITFGPNGKIYLSTDLNWVNNGTLQLLPNVYELNYNNLGIVTAWSILIDGTNFGNQFLFTSTPGQPLSIDYHDVAICFETAYAGNGQLYVICAAMNGNSIPPIPPFGGPDPLVNYQNLPEEGHYCLMKYDINNLNWNLEYSIPWVWQQTRHTMSIEVSPISPNVIYLGSEQPSRLVKNSSGNWTRTFLATYGSSVYHADTRIIKIYHSENTPNNPGSNDIVYWGNDGGISKSIGNTMYNFNGIGFNTNEINDVDVSETGNLRIAAAMHNHFFNTTNTPLWQNPGVGDGYNSIYDKRFGTSLGQKVLFHEEDWDVYGQNANGNTGTYPGPVFNPPYFTNTIDTKRAGYFPRGFNDDLMYIGNRNLFESHSNDYTWDKISVGGYLNNDGKIKEICKAIVIPQKNPERKYYALKSWHDKGYDKTVFVYKNFTLKWVDITPSVVYTDKFTVTDMVGDSKDEKRVFISLGFVKWNNPGMDRVIVSSDEGSTWSTNTNNNMSSGLTELPVTKLVYQEGSDDIIYAGTDAGVYRWDKPQQCWVKFNGGIDPNIKMPNMLITDLKIDYCKGTLVASSFGRGIWETELYNPNVIPPVTETISVNTTWGTLTGTTTDKHIKGSILIQSGATLTIEGITPNANLPLQTSTNIYMPKYGTIYVEQGARLEVRNSTITNDCAMWYGIQAFGNSLAKQDMVTQSTGLDPNHGEVILLKAIISNAEEAFSNGGGPGPFNNGTNNTGGIIQASGSTFINNWRSAAFGKYSNVGLPLFILQKDLSYFNDCLFTQNDDSKQGFYCHISMWGVRGILLLNNQFENLRNLETSHERALYTIDATYDLIGGTPSKSKVDGFYTGVESVDFSWVKNVDLYPITISHTLFDKNEIGLSMGSIENPIINDNTFTIGLKQTPVPSLPSWSYFSLGTKLVNTSNFSYCGNTHTYLSSPYQNTVFQYTAGTEIQNAGANNVVVKNNSYHNLLIGNDCDYKNADPSGAIGITYRYNTNTGNKRYDFIFQANAEIKENQSDGGGNATENIFSQTTGVVNWDHNNGNHNAVTYRYENVINQTPNAASSTFTKQVANPANATACIYAKVGLSKNDAFQLSDLTGLKSNYDLAELEYNNYKEIYDQLIDAGNTQGTLEDIENNVLSEAMQIRTLMLSRSPYVSEEVLRALVDENSLPPAILLEILAANPDATRNEDFIEYIQFGCPNPLPTYMINIIKATWDGTTIRTVLENNIGDAHEKMSDSRNEILMLYAVEPSIYNDDSIMVWMNKVKTLRNQYSVVEHLLNNKEYENAEELLSTFQTTYKMNEFEKAEYDAYIELYNFKKGLLENDIEINALDSIRLGQLKVIADNTHFSFARDMARNALCFFYHICYPDLVRTLPEETSNKTHPTLSKVEDKKEVTVYPNPAKDYVVFYYNLLHGNAASKLIVTDMLGKLKYKIDITGTQSQHIWDTRNYVNGNYIYTLTTTNGKKYTGKLSIIK